METYRKVNGIWYKGETQLPRNIQDELNAAGANYYVSEVATFFTTAGQPISPDALPSLAGTAGGTSSSLTDSAQYPTSPPPEGFRWDWSESANYGRGGWVPKYVGTERAEKLPLDTYDNYNDAIADAYSRNATNEARGIKQYYTTNRYYDPNTNQTRWRVDPLPEVDEPLPAPEYTVDDLGVLWRRTSKGGAWQEVEFPEEGTPEAGYATQQEAAQSAAGMSVEGYRYVPAQSSSGRWYLSLEPIEETEEPWTGLSFQTGPNGTVYAETSQGRWEPVAQRSLDDMIVDAIVEGTAESWQKAQTLFNFQNQLSIRTLDQEDLKLRQSLFDQAMSYATAPGDYYTLMGMMYGEIPGLAEGQRVPVAPFLEQAAQQLFGGQLATQPAPQLATPPVSQPATQPVRMTPEQETAALQNAYGGGFQFGPPGADFGPQTMTEDDYVKNLGQQEKAIQRQRKLRQEMREAEERGDFSEVQMIQAQMEAAQGQQAVFAKRIGGSIKDFGPYARGAQKTPEWELSGGPTPHTTEGMMFPKARASRTPEESTAEVPYAPQQSVFARATRTPEESTAEVPYAPQQDIYGGIFARTPEIGVRTPVYDESGREIGFTETFHQSPERTVQQRTVQQPVAASMGGTTFGRATGLPKRFTQAMYSGQPFGKTRDFAALSGIPFRSGQEWLNMSSLEKGAIQSEVERRGFPWDEWQRQQQKYVGPFRPTSTTRFMSRKLYNRG